MQDESAVVMTIADTWDLRIHRQPARRVFLSTANRPGLSSQTREFRTSLWHRLNQSARAHPYDFLLHSIPQLTEAGFEIYGEDKLKLGKINRSTPVLRVSITSGIDWFDPQDRGRVWRPADLIS
ncbi:hypothetical protein [Candidatus Villigracilis saccharophilus]|uniref:hypothetical protein n=1 Tax=Candidatus Villigracilis saccharophilus TaxID=3140684 RepID=UPI0031370105|nr:hypothetical protein [Anaerolineales bacterium]